MLNGRCYLIWLLFLNKEVDLSKVKCKECDKIYSLGSDKPKFQIMHGLKNHLAKCHTSHLFALTINT